MGRVGRAQFQQESDPNTVQADGWIEPMPWKIDPKAKQKWGAIVFQNDPNAPFSLDPKRQERVEHHRQEQHPTRPPTIRSTASTARAG